MSSVSLRPVDDDIMTEEDKEVARKELNEDPVTREELLDKFFHMCKAHPGAPPTIDRGLLLAYLRHRKFNLERAVKSMEKCNQLIASVSEIFQNLQFESKRPFFQNGTFGGLPFRDQKGRFVYLLRMGYSDAKVLNLKEILQLSSMVTFWHSKFSASQIHGIVTILDMSGVTWSHVTSFMDFSLRNFLFTMMQECYPLRVKALHILYPNFFVRSFVKLIKPLMTQKLLQRTYLHNDPSSLHKHISPSVLPAEYKGDQPKYSGLDTFEKILPYQLEYSRAIDTVVRCFPKNS